MTNKPIKVTNTITGTSWTFPGIRTAQKELGIDSRYITAYCEGRKKFHSGIYLFSFVEKGDKQDVYEV